MKRLRSSALHHPVCTIVLSTFLHMCCFSRKWRWCDDAKTILPWHNNYGTVEHRFIAIVLSSSCPRITANVPSHNCCIVQSRHRTIAVAPSCHRICINVIVPSSSHRRVIAPSNRPRCCDSEPHGPIRIPHITDYLAGGR